jgi:hypothetical protein
LYVRTEDDDGVILEERSDEVFGWEDLDGFGLPYLQMLRPDREVRRIGTPA